MAKASPKTAKKGGLKALPELDETLVVTKDGLKALQEECDDLKTRGRKEVAERLKEAISYGDLSENSEYEEAKNYQAFVEGRIIELENMIKNAKVVDEKQHSRQMVEIGTRVVVRAKQGKEEHELTIVGATEADPFNNRISSEAPMGAALMGSKAGDTVVVEAPDGVAEYEVVKLA